MATPQSFGDFLKSTIAAVGEWFRSTFAWLTGTREASAAPATPPAPTPTPPQDRARIREELTQRMADLKNDPDFNKNIGRAMGRNGFRVIGDNLFRGGLGDETQARIQRSMQELESELPADDQANMREIRRLMAAGNFSPQERDEITNQALERAQKAEQRAR